ncbi:MAG: phosphate ABC transporter permease PstA [Desulfomonilaceae bacterium]|nr:phosphate ABC transporter permease PstA [Desulfomonilaceae bacterium]
MKPEIVRGDSADASETSAVENEQLLSSEKGAREATASEASDHIRAKDEMLPEKGGRGVSRKSMVWDFKARGEPFLWGLGGALTIGIMMIVGFVVLIVYNGLLTFYPKPIERVVLKSGAILAGETTRSEVFRPGPETLKNLSPQDRKLVEDLNGYATRNLYRTGNFDLYNDDFRWVSDYDVAEIHRPRDLIFLERMEWGPFIGTIKSADFNGKIVDKESLKWDELKLQHRQAEKRRKRVKEIERDQLGAINHLLERDRLKLRKVEIKHGKQSAEYLRTLEDLKGKEDELQSRHEELSREAAILKELDAKYTVTMADVGGREVNLRISDMVRFYPANDLSFVEKLGIYLSRWWEFLTDEPREANTEGGVMPAIFGTFCMTVLMSLAVAPFGVMAALYLREYARQGRLVSLVRICVNNLAGVPSIVYGVFGLGFFAYVLGGSIDQLFFPERLPNPTFGTGGLLWASLTLALLTVPVVIVATEEALAAVPQSMREASLACGASKWQTIKNIVLPRAMPGIMTGLILAMARGAGEVAPLMLIGVVKMAPELPIDQFFPYIHLERSFMHLGFHIYDVGFQSRNSEAAKPMVFVTTLLLIFLVFLMNAASITLRNRLKRKFFTGHF